MTSLMLNRRKQINLLFSGLGGDSEIFRNTNKSESASILAKTGAGSPIEDWAFGLFSFRVHHFIDL